MHIREAEITAAEAIREFLVIDAELIKKPVSN